MGKGTNVPISLPGSPESPLGPVPCGDALLDNALSSTTSLLASTRGVLAQPGARYPTIGSPLSIRCLLDRSTIGESRLSDSRRGMVRLRGGG